MRSIGVAAVLVLGGGAAARGQVPASAPAFVTWRPAGPALRMEAAARLGSIGAAGTRSHTGKGLLIGGIVGAVATSVFLIGFCSDADTSCGADEVGRAVLIIGVPPAVAGAVIGSLIRTPR